jgi:pyruvate dehydrogenase E1 component alpha subunit
MSVEVNLLYQMMRIRAVEEDISGRYSEQVMRCPTHLSIGQEAVASAAGLVLNNNDYAVSTHRGHAHYLGKGGNLKAMLSEIYGKETGCSRGRGGSMHLIDTSVGFMGTTAIVGNSIPIGVGLGLSCKLDGGNQVACIFLGDGAVEEGVFYEAVNFSAVKKLPVLFICENNLYSVYSPLHVRQPKGRNIFEMVEAIGVTSSSGNGNDALETYNLIDNSVSCIREGSGPQFIELSTYRWREHCGPNYDNDLEYRSEDEFLKWKDIDPIATLYSDLIDRGVINEQDQESAKRKIADEIKDAFKFAEDSPFPDASEAYADEYFLN